MRPLQAQARASTGGFTLLESMISAVIFVIVGYTLASAFTLGTGTQRTVTRIARTNSSLRESSGILRDELRATGEAQLTVTPLPGGNHQVDLRVPIDVAGVATWGVHDRHLGPTPDLQNQAGWTVRYTVLDLPDGAGGVDRQLVRQLLDVAGDIQRQTAIARGLRSGAAVPQGFSVTQIGGIWEVRIATQGEAQGAAGRETSFHVRTRN